MIALGNGQIALGDCLDIMRSVPTESVDMILCDLPYGTTQNKWDSVIPFEPLWREYWRVCKGAVVLTAAQPFTSALVMSQVQYFKYDWVWEKSLKTNFLNAKKQPLRKHESVLVFYKKQPHYNPQKPDNPRGGKVSGGNKLTNNYGDWTPSSGEKDYQELPSSVLMVPNPALPGAHPTQKPVALFEYLIRTYTNEGDTVLDNCLGSGTTAIAAENTGRRWIGIERDPGYFGAACERIARAVTDRAR